MLLVSGSADGTVAIWNPEKSRIPLYESSFGETITSAVWSSGDRAVMIGSASGQVEVWDLAA
jgi:WD40 repeat protein